MGAFTPSIASFLAAAIEKTIAQALSYDPGSKAKIIALNGKAISVVITDLSCLVRLRFTEDDVLIGILNQNESQATEDQVGDLRLSGSAKDLASLVQSETYSLAGSGVRAEGSVALLEQIHCIAQNLEIDWEDAIGQKLGPLAAGPLGLAIKKSTAFFNSGFTNTQNQISDFIANESNWALHANEFQAFKHDVNDMRQRIERLEAQLLNYQSDANASKKSTDSLTNTNFRELN